MAIHVKIQPISYEQWIIMVWLHILQMLHFLLEEAFSIPLLVGLLTVGSVRECNFQIHCSWCSDIHYIFSYDATISVYY